MIRSIFSLKSGQLYNLGYKRFYNVYYELNGKKYSNSWPGPSLKPFKSYVEDVCKEFGIKHFQFVFKKRVYSYTCGNWSIE